MRTGTGSRHRNCDGNVIVGGGMETKQVRVLVGRVGSQHVERGCSETRQVRKKNKFIHVPRYQEFETHQPCVGVEKEVKYRVQTS